MANQIKDKERIERRKRIFVDADVQTALLRQMALSWLVVLGVITAVLLAVESYKADFALGLFGSLAAMWRHNAALVITIGALAPFIIYDSVKLSHRFAGPMVSLRRALRRLGEGENVPAICFRKDDFWKEVADSFNRVVDRVNRTEARGSDDLAVGDAKHVESDSSAIEPVPESERC